MTTLQKKLFAEMLDENLFVQAVDYGNDYKQKAFERNVFPTQGALDDLKFFDEPFPDQTSNGKEILNTLHQYGSPATLTSIGGRYFGFVIGSVIPVGMAAKILATFWDQNSGMFVTSPIAAKLETIAEQWLKSIFNLPKETVAGFVSGTSMANFCGLIAARYRLLKNQGWDVNKQGLGNAPAIRVVASKEAHSTILKMTSVLGLGQDNIEYIDADEQGRIKTELVQNLDNKTLLILQAGNVNSGAFDDFSSICKKAKDAGAWIHIDGAFGLWAAASKKLKYLTNGIEFANSWAVDGHKTLNTPYDSGIVMCSDKEALTSALHMSAGYIVLSDDRDSMFYTPEMSRRARAVELWAIMKYLGKEGLDEMIEEMYVRAKQFADSLSNMEGFEVVNEMVFNQVLVKCATDKLTDAVLKNIQEDRICWVGGSVWKEQKVIRISVCSWATTEKDVNLSVESFKRSLEKALVEQPQKMLI